MKSLESWHNFGMEDEKLMLQYQANDQEAFNRLYEKYAAVVYGYLKKRAPASDVEDLYQNVWKHFHEKRHLYSQRPFAPWFFTLIRNLLIDHYRANGRNTRTLQELRETVGDYPNELDKDIEAIIESLPPQSQQLVRRYFFEGSSYSELEREMGVSQMGLRKRLSRVITLMKREIKGFEDEK